jgi:hypothetical protein
VLAIGTYLSCSDVSACCGIAELRKRANTLHTRFTLMPPLLIRPYEVFNARR